MTLKATSAGGRAGGVDGGAGSGAAVRRLGRRHPLLPVLLGVVLYSTGPVFVAASTVSGAVFSLWRLWFGVGALAVATAVHAAVTGGWPDRRAWRWPLGAGLAFGAHQLMMFTAVKATSVADVTLINTLSPIVTGLLAIPVFAERPGSGFRGWSLVATAGAGVIVLGGSSGPQGDPVGMLLALGNVVAFAVFFILSKRSRDHLDVLPFLFGVMSVAAVAVTGYSVALGEAVGAVTSTDLLYAAVVALGPGLLGHFVMTWPLRWVPANVPPVLRLGIPVLASLWAWWLLGQQVTVLHVVGGVVTVTGVTGALASRGGRELLAEERRATRQA